MTDRNTATLAAIVAIVCGCAPAGQAPGPGPAPAPGVTWQKPGADQQTVSRDSFSCREAAQAAAMQRYPYRAGLGVGAGGAVIGQQQDVVDRSTMEAAHYNACMQERGYQRQ